MAKREAIIAAAGRLFARQGFEKTTVEQIALRAGVSRRTFFRYFPTKDLVAFPHHQLHLELFRKALWQEREGVDGLEAVLAACSAMTQGFMAERQAHLRQQRIIRASPTLIARGDQLDREWEEVVAVRLAVDNPPTSAGRRRARMLSAALMGVIGAVLREWYDGRCRKDLAQLAREGFALFESPMIRPWLATIQHEKPTDL